MKKLIPPFLVLICIMLMVFLHKLFPIAEIVPSPFHYSGILFILLGAWMVISIILRFRKVKTELNPFKKPRQLVVTGLFAFSRNPIYLGFTVLLFGVNVLLGSASSILVVLAFIFIIDKWYIPLEERNMESVFDDEYRYYKQKVSRWI
jgi:protein-S-isoprenylcysteine O-methyltransferase Ste14